jgi:hypothetical protein
MAIDNLSLANRFKQATQLEQQKSGRQMVEQFKIVIWSLTIRRSWIKISKNKKRRKWKSSERLEISFSAINC